jgi:hypothetical protein
MIRNRMNLQGNGSRRVEARETSTGLAVPNGSYTSFGLLVSPVERWVQPIVSINLPGGSDAGQHGTPGYKQTWATRRVCGACPSKE